MQDTVHTSKGLVQLYNTGDSLVLVETDFERFIVDDAVDVAGKVVQNLKRQVTKRLLGTLNPLAGVGLGECNTKVFANGLDLLLVARLGNFEVSSAGKSIQVFDAVAKIRVVDTRLEAEPVLYRAGKGVKQVERRKLVEQVLLSKFAFALSSVVPDCSCHILTDEDQLTPVFSALGVSLIRSACSEGNSKTDDETEHGQKECADFKLKNELRDACNQGRPQSHYCEWYYHLGKDGTVHSHKVRPFAVLGQVARTNLLLTVSKL